MYLVELPIAVFVLKCSYAADYLLVASPRKIIPNIPSKAVVAGSVPHATVKRWFNLPTISKKRLFSLFHTDSMSSVYQRLFASSFFITGNHTGN